MDRLTRCGEFIASWIEDALTKSTGGGIAFSINARLRPEGSNAPLVPPISRIGRPNRVYEILNRKRPLTLSMIKRLHHELGIPAESLIGSRP